MWETMHVTTIGVQGRYSLSLNGRMLSNLGKGADQLGGYYSKLVQEYDGILFSSDFLSGASTLPMSLEAGANQPFLIIIARNITSLHLPSTIINPASHVIVMAEKSVNVKPKSENVETVLLEQMTLTSVLDYCGRRGLCSIVLDFMEYDGPFAELIEGSLEGGLVQKVMMELLPVWSGSSGASLPCFDIGQKKLKDVQLNITNESVLVEGYLS